MPVSTRPIHPKWNDANPDRLDGFKENGEEGLAWGPVGTEIPDSDDVALAADLDALEIRVDATEAAIVALDGRVDATEADIVALDLRIDALETDGGSLDSRLDAEEALSISFDTRLDAEEAASVALDGRLDTAESDIDDLEAAVLALELLGFVDVDDDYTLELTDLRKWVNLENTDDETPFTITIPANGDVAFPVGSAILFEQVDVGAFVFEGDVGVTLNAPSTDLDTMTNGQRTVCALVKKATNEWTLFGSLAEAP